MKRKKTMLWLLYHVLLPSMVALASPSFPLYMFGREWGSAPTHTVDSRAERLRWRQWISVQHFTQLDLMITWVKCRKSRKVIFPPALSTIVAVLYTHSTLAKLIANCYKLKCKLFVALPFILVWHKPYNLANSCKFSYWLRRWPFLQTRPPTLDLLSYEGGMGGSSLPLSQ